MEMTRGAVTQAGTRSPARHRLRQGAILLGLAVGLAALTAGGIAAYQYGSALPSAQANSTPEENLRQIAQQAGYPVLAPTQLPAGASLLSANGGVNCTTCPAPFNTSYEVDLAYSGPAGAGGPGLTYYIHESKTPYNFSFGYSDPFGGNHPPTAVSRQVTIAGQPATLTEYTVIWHDTRVTHGFDLKWTVAGVHEDLVVEDVLPSAAQAGDAHPSLAPADLALQLPPASADDLLRMAASFQPVKS